MYFELRLILAILTCYRLARMIALDDGPLFIFKRFRYWVKDDAWIEANIAGDTDSITQEIDGRHYGIWHNLSEGLECPYCVGIWLSLPLLALLIWPSVCGDWFLVLMAISGGQAFMQSQDKMK